MRILVTGAAGFLGWHTRVRLHALTGHDVVAVGRAEWPDLASFVAGIDAVIHIAGVNRAPDDEVENGNAALAKDLVAALRYAQVTPRVVYANSIQAGNGTPYGTGKERAGQTLAAYTEAADVPFTDVRLPNLFGEHGRPGYNSFVATFAHAAVAGTTPEITDREVRLLHVQAAAQSLIDGLAGDGNVTEPLGTAVYVCDVWEHLRRSQELYATGDIPPLISDLDVDLFNTLRAAQFPDAYPIPLTQRSDARGNLVEVVRAHGGQGQTFVSTTKPGITRGEHFHLRKVERFVVVKGRARISLRKVLTDDVVSFDVEGDAPAVVDMPPMWAHNITNTGDDELMTLFWTHELFDPGAPDTFPEPVGQAMGVATRAGESS